MHSEWPTARVLVVGDSGVGKTSLVSLLTTGKQQLASKWTVGCNLQVMPYQHDSSSGSTDVFIEFWDVGGAKKYAHSRHVFYTGVHGVMLVYDASNRKSYANLRKWIHELVVADAAIGGIEGGSVGVGGGGSTTSSHHDPRVRRGLRNRSGSATGPSLLPGAGAPGGTTQSPFDGGFSWAKAASWLPGIPKKKSVDYTRAAKRLGELPVIVVANKSDLLSPSFRRPNTLADYGIESVEMNALVTPATPHGHARKLHPFFRKVLKRALHRQPHGTPATASAEDGGSGSLGSFSHSMDVAHGLISSMFTPTRLVAPVGDNSPQLAPVATAGHEDATVVFNP